MAKATGFIGQIPCEMPSRKKPTSAARSATPTGEAAIALARDLLGHLNFSSGKEDTAFLAALNRTSEFLHPFSGAALREWLLPLIDALSAENPAFRDTQQARAVLTLTIDHVLPAYRAFHSDLLFHLPPEEFEQPFLLGRMFEAVLSEGLPGTMWPGSRRARFAG